MKAIYVVGFAFDIEGQVALIEKQKPEWQKGKLNGMGGKLEPTDAGPAQAMAREFHEETGVSIDAADWRLVGVMENRDEWLVHVFTVRHPDVKKVFSMTDEVVRLVTCRWFERHRDQALPNVALLIEASLLVAGHHGSPYLTLTYDSPNA